MSPFDHTRSKHSDKTLKLYKEIYDTAIDYVKDHLSHDRLLLADFCTDSGYKRRSVQRALSWYVTSWSGILRLQRMNVAMRLLVDDHEMPVAQIGRKVGYRDEDAFVKAFAKFMGLTPERYRKVTPRGR